MPYELQRWSGVQNPAQEPQNETTLESENT